ncbi:MAG: LegC family aminotransferase [Eubacterium sp.]|jgi:perosamine synthetase|nr:LegC family aminotransferase [Eubacterium sp.]
MERFIPLSIPNFEGNESKYVNDALDQGWVSTGGAYIQTLEERMAQFLQTEQVAACQSGTAALHLSLIACRVMPGDLVIVPTLTFIAAVNPVRYQFADPVFIDCDDSLCMDPVKLERFCREECEKSEDGLIHKKTGKQVKALIVVHVFGNLADMEQIMQIAKAYGLPVIEDATEALGTKYLEGMFAGKFAGTIGDYGAFSFNGNKIITTGGGGAVTAKSAQTVEYLRYLSTQAKDDPHNYIHHEIGYNYRMTNLQAALGVAQMEELPEFIRRKQANYERYCALFEDFALGSLMMFRDGTSANKWLYALHIDMEKLSGSLLDLIGNLQKRGIQTRAVWGLIHEQKPYQGAIAYEIEKAAYYSRRILNIPCSTQITEDEIACAAGEIRKAIEELQK